MYKIFPTEDGAYQIWYCPSPAIASVDPRLPAAYPDKQLYGPTKYRSRDSAQTAKWRILRRVERQKSREYEAWMDKMEGKE